MATKREAKSPVVYAKIGEKIELISCMEYSHEWRYGLDNCFRLASEDDFKRVLAALDKDKKVIYVAGNYTWLNKIGEARLI